MSPFRHGGRAVTGEALSVPLVVEVINRQRRHPVDRERVRRVARQAHRAAGGEGGAITILLTADERIRELNRRFRGLDRPTDVLSFPDGEVGPEGRHVGDIAISMETAARSAAEESEDLGAAVDRLVAHGVLHLLGYDHDNDDGEMMALQARVLQELHGGAGS